MQIERSKQGANTMDKDDRWLKRNEKLALLALIFLIDEGRAYAYTDPGSGLFILQLLTSAGIGLLFYLRRLKVWIANWSNRGGSKADD